MLIFLITHNIIVATACVAASLLLLAMVQVGCRCDHFVIAPVGAAANYLLDACGSMTAMVCAAAVLHCCSNQCK